ncbi:MAG: DedA family protein [Polynucleobacter sp.]|nr:DedA family protein [Polynucleobacter sp.]
MQDTVQSLLQLFGLPDVGLPALLVVAFLSATFLPFASEPILLAYINLNPQQLWVAIMVATVGNALGGIFNWLLGYFAHRAVDSLWGPKHQRLKPWLEKQGPILLLFSWLPIIGDPLCFIAGWLRLSLIQSWVYITIGKLARYIAVTAVWFSIF